MLEGISHVDWCPEFFLWRFVHRSEVKCPTWHLVHRYQPLNSKKQHQVKTFELSEFQKAWQKGDRNKLHDFWKFGLFMFGLNGTHLYQNSRLKNFPLGLMCSRDRDCPKKDKKQVIPFCHLDVVKWIEAEELHSSRMLCFLWQQFCFS